MKKVFGALLLIVFGSFSGNSQLIISQYYEGASNDKCIEIFNTTGSPINLAGYSLQFFFNGSSSASTTINLSGTIGACGTWVVCDNDANPTLLSVADQTSTSSFYNGDDAVGLYNGGTLLDLFGNIGCDPGSEWTNISPGTADGNFERASGYCTGVASDPGGSCNSTAFPSFTAANWSSIPLAGTAGLGSHTSTCCGGGGANTITTGTVSGGPFTINCTTGDAGSVAFTSSGTFTAGNIYTVQLSDASGSFTSPTNMGTLTSTANSGTINFSIPAGTAAGSGYRIRVIASNPSTVGSDNGSNITINLSGTCEYPYMTSVIINSCNQTCDEGFNEVIFGYTGDFSVDANNGSINVGYGTAPSPATTLTETFVNDATLTSDLNTIAGCPLFVDAAGSAIPAGASFMIAHEGLCTDALDFSSLCSNTPIYILYTTDPDWDINGNFVNSTGCSGGIRYFQTSITTTSGYTHTVDYSYDCSANSGTDGDYATWGPTGGMANLQGNNDCSLTPIVLPIELGLFNGHPDANFNTLNWTVLSQINTHTFTLQRSLDAIDFYGITELPAAGFSNESIDYVYHDHDIDLNQGYYYRLLTTDLDGQAAFSSVVYIDRDFDLPFVSNQNMELSIRCKSDCNYHFQVYDTNGRLITGGLQSGSITTHLPSKGMYLVVIQQGVEMHTTKIIVH